jgi:lysozyme
VNSLDGGETRLERWIEKQGANWMNTVPGESWHGEISRTDLAKLFRKFRPKPKPKPPQRLSIKGRQFLAAREGAIRYAYNDSAGHATFGIGHLLHHGPVTEEDRRKWGTKANPAPMAVVLRVFDQDIKRYEATVRESVGRRLPQHRFDALVSLCFNIGQGAFAKSTVVRELKAKKRGFVNRAADAILLWKKPPELIARRRMERRLFLRGDYGT